MQKYTIVLFLLSLTVAIATAQEYNPFELEERLEQNISQGERVPADKNNPFEIEYTKPIGIDLQKTKEKEQLKERFTKRERRENNLEFWIILFITLYFSFAVSFYRIFLNNLSKSLMNINMMERFHRDRKYSQLPLTIFYVLFFANLSYFICMVLNIFWEIPFELSRFGLIFVIVIALYLAKHILLSFSDFLLQIGKEIRLYNFSVRIYGIAIGIALMPINIVFSLEYEGLETILIYIALCIIGLVLLMRFTRGLLIARPYLPLHLFHFFVYLCTVEIAPIVLIRNVFLAIE
jgi:hypothetical protein